MEQNNHDGRNYSIRALQRGLSVLDTFLEARTPLKLEQICAHTGLAKATAFRVVLNLIQKGYLVETEEGYWLGLKLLRLGTLIEEKLDLTKRAMPTLKKLLDEFNETVHFAVLDEDLRVLYLEKLTARRAVGIMMSQVGVTSPLHCTGLGKAMAAFLPEGRIERWVHQHGLRDYTQATITEDKKFFEELERIRSRGYSTDVGEHEESVRCIAAPIRDRTGSVIAAVSIAGPDTRMPDNLVDSSMARKVQQSAEEISEALGYTPEATYSS